MWCMDDLLYGWESHDGLAIGLTGEGPAMPLPLPDEDSALECIAGQLHGHVAGSVGAKILDWIKNGV